MHVIFSTDGRTPIDDAQRMHRLRRSFCKGWRNARWREMMLAFLGWWSDGASKLKIPVSPNAQFSLLLPPMTFLSGVAPGQDAQEAPGVESDDDEDDSSSVDDFADDSDEPTGEGSEAEDESGDGNT